MALPLGARIHALDAGNFLALDAGGYVHRRHVWPSTLPGHSPLPTSAIETARLFLGAPYLWGGRTPAGVDCSGLVQAALALIGIAAPRDSDQQRESLGRAVEGPAQPGDLLFFPGHVGLLSAPETLLHANAHWMTCCEEPLADVLARLDLASPLAIRRL
jgi:cell wall-associated NlpC family hydrolase